MGINSAVIDSVISIFIPADSAKSFLDSVPESQNLKPAMRTLESHNCMCSEGLSFSDRFKNTSVHFSSPNRGRNIKSKSKKKLQIFGTGSTSYRRRQAEPTAVALPRLSRCLSRVLGTQCERWIAGPSVRCRWLRIN